jgi:hypothetical protein
MGIHSHQATYMSEHDKESASGAAKTDTVKDLAMRIYVEFAAKHYADGVPKDALQPKQIALLSFKLAEAFLEVHREINHEANEVIRKRTYFNTDDLDVGGMMKG